MHGSWKRQIAAPVVLLLGLLGVGAPVQGAPAVHAAPAIHAADAGERAFLDTLEARTFRFFWERSDSLKGLTPDRWPTRSFISVGATGFALTAYPIGVERGYVSRAAARERVLRTLRFFWQARQDTARAGSTGYKGFFYHFLEPESGARFKDVELSTVDTGLLLCGALFCQSYFDRPHPAEREIRSLAEKLYERVDFRWARVRPPTLCLGWSPEAGFLPYDWRGYNETILFHVLALASPTRGVNADTWKAYTQGYKWGDFEGHSHLGFAPLFGHQYSHIWIDFRGIQDDYMREHHSDYFKNSREATLAQIDYAVKNPGDWRGYSDSLWGLTACDGPLDGALQTRGRSRDFHTYWPRGASFTHVNDDGTICPAAAGGSIPFTPDESIRCLRAMQGAYGDAVFGEYGFVDAFNPTIPDTAHVSQGRVAAGLGWFDTDYLGIDQGPILAMLENYRSGLIWKTMRKNSHLARGLRRAGFAGGWLERKSR